MNPWTIAAGVAVAHLGGALGRSWWREGRDRRYLGSPIDQVMGTPSGESEAVPIGEGEIRGPVEFAPPENVRPGQIGTLLDERANVIDVTATIVDLAGRGFLLIGDPRRRSVLEDGLDPDPAGEGRQRAARLRAATPRCLFRDGNEVTVSELKTAFAERLHGVEASLYADAMRQKWFRARPNNVRTRWAVRGVLLLVIGAVVTFALARWTHWGIVGTPVTRQASRSR